MNATCDRILTASELDDLRWLASEAVCEATSRVEEGDTDPRCGFGMVNRLFECCALQNKLSTSCWNPWLLGSDERGQLVLQELSSDDFDILQQAGERALTRVGTSLSDNEHRPGSRFYPPEILADLERLEPRIERMLALVESLR